MASGARTSRRDRVRESIIERTKIQLSQHNSCIAPCTTPEATATRSNRDARATGIRRAPKSGRDDHRTATTLRPVTLSPHRVGASKRRNTSGTQLAAGMRLAKGRRDEVAMHQLHFPGTVFRLGTARCSPGEAACQTRHGELGDYSTSAAAACRCLTASLTIDSINSAQEGRSSSMPAT
ncbi:MAG: hypothetical protein QOD39_5267 [Mycobacterium sp.]|nr:hypothetical protein [Mycobacterium sp.]